MWNLDIKGLADDVVLSFAFAAKPQSLGWLMVRPQGVDQTHTLTQHTHTTHTHTIYTHSTHPHQHRFCPSPTHEHLSN